MGTHYVELSNHPTEQQFVETVEANLPRHLVLKHVHEQRAKEIGGRFDNLFYWANDDTRAHRLYTAGDWPAPPWLDDSTASRIRRRNYRQSGSRIPIDRPIDDLPTAPLTRQAPALAAEGVDVSPFEERFESTPTDEPTTPADPASADGGRGSAPAAADSGGDGIADRPLEGDGELVGDVTDRLEGIEARLDALEGSFEDFHASFDDLEAGFDELTDAFPEESAVETGLTTLDDRLDALETTMEDLPGRIEAAGGDPVPGTVLRQVDLVLFRVDADELTDHDVSLEHRQDVELTITEVQNDLSDGG